jgi:c-di-GMP-binding flagellar brake protein YcgR
MAETEVKIINSHNLIADLMQRMQKGRANIRLKFLDDHELYSSIVLSVHADKRAFVIDELNPMTDLERSILRKPLEVFAEVDGVAVQFMSQIVKVGMNKDGRFYILPFPQQVRYEQKRDAYRIPTAISEDIKTIIHWNNVATSEGRLHDMSAGGVSISLNQPPTLDVDVNKSIPRCEIFFPEYKEPFECRLQIRNYRDIDRTFLLGASFYALSPRQQRMIEKFVASQDRKRRRRSAY